MDSSKSFLNKKEIIEGILDGRLEDEFITQFTSTPKEDLIQYPHSLGQWIRNSYRLWCENYPHLNGKHPDDFSFEIIEELHKRLIDPS